MLVISRTKATTRVGGWQLSEKISMRFFQVLSWEIFLWQSKQYIEQLSNLSRGMEVDYNKIIISFTVGKTKTLNKTEIINKIETQ